MFRPAILMLLSLGFWLGNPLLGATSQHGIIGARLSPAKDGESLAVGYVAAHSAAALAGIKSGDTVTAIDGVATSGMSGKAGTDLLKGAIGTEVAITIRRAGSADRTIFISRQSWVEAYSKAAAEGDSYAEYNLGSAYYYGLGAEKDFSKAAEWYGKSADTGYAFAQLALGDMYQSGKGVEKDETAATGWFDKAAAQGNSEGEERLGEQFYWGHGTAKNYSTAFAWFYAAALQDDPWAEYYLGRLYSHGEGVKKDYLQSFGWAYRSAQQNNPRGEAGLGYLYGNGFGVRKNPVEALRCYQDAQTALPDDDQIKHDVAIATLMCLLKSPVVESFNPEVLPESYLKRVRILFEICALASIVGFVLLLFYTLPAGCAPPRLPVAVGWLLYNPASQGALLAAILLFSHFLSPMLYFGMMGLVTVLPVIVSSFGANRARIWKAPEVSWGKLLLLLVIAGVGYVAFDFCYGIIYTVVTHGEPPPQSTVYMIAKSKRASAWITYLVVAVAAPIEEEIGVRGYLFDALRKRLGGKTVVVITAAIFAAMHYNLTHFLPLFGIGLAFGWLKLKTDSVRPSMFLHMLNNAIVTAMLS